MENGWRWGNNIFFSNKKNQMGLFSILRGTSMVKKIGITTIGIVTLSCLGYLIVISVPPRAIPCETKSVTNDTSSVILFNPTMEEQDILISRGLKKLDSCMCDANLQLWGGEGISIFGNDGVAKSGGGSPGAAGDPNDFSKSPYLTGIKSQISPNYFIIGDTTDLSFSKTVNKLFIPKKNTVSSDSSVIVITDSGVESNNLITYDSNGEFLHGWNFVTDSNDVNYAESNTHGTSVNYLIEKNLSGVKSSNYRILPLVVLGRNNTGTLFDYLCALAYIKFMKDKYSFKIRIVNSSLGYYGYSSLILENFISVLDSNNILLVSAAGNKADSSDCGFKDSSNLDARRLKFFPASYSGTLGNVKAITTYIYKDLTNPSTYDISYGQKYSVSKVNFAIEPDLINISKNDYYGYFKFDNLFEREENISSMGSSYATPIATAYYYSLLVKTDKNDRLRFKILEEPYNNLEFPYILDSLNQFRNEIKGGRVLRKK